MWYRESIFLTSLSCWIQWLIITVFITVWVNGMNNTFPIELSCSRLHLYLLTSSLFFLGLPQLWGKGEYIPKRWLLNCELIHLLGILTKCRVWDFAVTSSLPLPPQLHQLVGSVPEFWYLLRRHTVFEIVYNVKILFMKTCVKWISEKVIYVALKGFIKTVCMLSLHHINEVAFAHCL